MTCSCTKAGVTTTTSQDDHGGDVTEYQRRRPSGPALGEVDAPFLAEARDRLSDWQ